VRLKGLYMGSFCPAGSVRHSRDNQASRNHPGET
jgi:hypothetical protein